MSRSLTPVIYDQPTSLKPYLELPHLLSLTWLAYPILSLIFIAFRLYISLDSSQLAIASAKTNLLASCQAAERAATGATSIPRYLAIASNEQFVESVNGTLRVARGTLLLALTAMEGIINFLIDLYRSTFLCFLELVIRGGLSIIIGAVQEFNELITNSLNSLRTSIQNDVASANNVIQAAVDGFNKLNPFGDVKIPTFDIPSLSGLQNVVLPTTFQDALVKLNQTIPTVDQIKEKLESIIDTPFELVKKEVNETFANLTFDASVLPVPAQNTVSFCADMDTSIVDDLGRDIVKTAKIGLGIIIGLIILLIAANCALEWYKWRTLQAHLTYTRESWQSDPTIVTNEKASGMPMVSLTNHNLMMLENTMANPLISRFVNRLSQILHCSPRTHIHLQWFFSYIFHTPALTVFLIGFFGLISVQLQLLALGPLEASYRAQTAASVAQFSNTIAKGVNESMFSQSLAYASDVNARVAVMQAQLDGGVFGWINTTTVELNTTITTFYTNVQSVVDDVFGGTILETPAKEFVRCILGTKVDAIENALTFLHENVQIELPKMKDSVLVMSPDMVDETTRPIALAAIGDNNNDGGDGGVVGKIVNAYAKSLRQERVMFAIFLALWGVVVLMALAVLFWHTIGHRSVEGVKRRRWQREQRAGIDGIVVPFRGGVPSHTLAPQMKSDEFFSSQPPKKAEQQTVFGRLFAKSKTKRDLRINVERAASVDSMPHIQVEQVQDEPVSAWSTTPSPRLDTRNSGLSWLRPSAPPKHPSRTNTTTTTAPMVPVALHHGFHGPKHPAFSVDPFDDRHAPVAR